jgi:hypothetical protein
VTAPGSFKKTIVRCHGEGATISSPPQPNYNLVVQTSAVEASATNNTGTLYISPDSQLGP